MEYLEAPFELFFDGTMQLLKPPYHCCFGFFTQLGKTQPTHFPEPVVRA